MKKLICMMCLLMVGLVPVSTFAENFSVRNGITFGMTFEETKKIDQIEEGNYTFGKDLSNDELGIQDGRLEDGSVAYRFTDRIGEKYMDVYYIFDPDDNGLNSIIYYDYCPSFSPYESEREIIENNDKILQDRYASTSCGGYVAMRSSMFRQIFKAYETVSHPVIEKRDFEYNQFLVPYDDCYAEIEHLIITDTLDGSFNGQSYDGKYWIYEYIIYTRVDKETASEFITEKAREQMEIENSKKNDF